MLVQERHIIHSVVYQKYNVKKAIALLYNNHLLRGSTRDDGIYIAQKIRAREMLTEDDWRQARRVARHHAADLARLANDGFFNIHKD